MRFLVRGAFCKGRNADVEVVETFDGGGEEHGVRKAGRLIDGEEKVAGKLG